MLLLIFNYIIHSYIYHLNLRAYLSLYISSNTSPTLTGPLTLRIRCLLFAYFPEMRITLTCVMPPLDPVLPKSCVTCALTGYESMANYI